MRNSIEIAPVIRVRSLTKLITVQGGILWHTILILASDNTIVLYNKNTVFIDIPKKKQQQQRTQTQHGIDFLRLSNNNNILS